MRRYAKTGRVISDREFLFVHLIDQLYFELFETTLVARGTS